MVRATILTMVLLLGRAAHRRRIAFLAVAAFIAVLLRPMVVAIGFQLSFLGLGIVLLGDCLMHRWHRCACAGVAPTAHLVHHLFGRFYSADIGGSVSSFSGEALVGPAACASGHIDVSVYRGFRSLSVWLPLAQAVAQL